MSITRAQPVLLIMLIILTSYANYVSQAKKSRRLLVDHRFWFSKSSASLYSFRSAKPQFQPALLIQTLFPISFQATQRLKENHVRIRFYSPTSALQRFGSVSLTIPYSVFLLPNSQHIFLHAGILKLCLLPSRSMETGESLRESEPLKLWTLLFRWWTPIMKCRFKCVISPAGSNLFRLQKLYHLVID